MLRKTIVVICFLTLAANLGAEARIDAKAGYALLNDLVNMFQTLAQTGTDGKGNADKALQQILTDANKARAEEKIDLIFYSKFSRMINLFRLSILPDPDGSVVGPLVEREINAFVLDVSGEDISCQKDKRLGPFAKAFGEEIINLRLYLETLLRRAEIWTDLEKNTNPFQK